MRNLRLLLVLLLVFSVGFAFGANTKTKKNEPTLVTHSSDEVVFIFNVDTYDFLRVLTPNGEEVIVKASNGGQMLEKGAPDLAKLATSVIVPDTGKMKVEVLDSKYIELDHIKVAPSKGNLLRTQDPRKIPYTYGKMYKKNRFYPEDIVEACSPYITGEFRGQAIVAYPFQYNPVTNVLRVYTEIKVRVFKNGKKKGHNELKRNKPLNVKQISREFKHVYGSHFLNYESVKEDAASNISSAQYTPLVDPIGRMLIVSYGDFMDEMADFVTWKESCGYTVDLVDYATIGSSSALKTYVSNYYNSNGLTYLLLVGDHAQVPTSSTSAGDSDNNYGYIVGNDHYLDIFVGRFSAETAAHVTTQANRTIYYERDLSSAATWFRQMTGMASNEGQGGGHNGGESDATHMNQIITDMQSYNYTTSTNYQDGGSIANLTSLINAGKGGLWYVGHGSDTAWTCGWNFSISNVDGLTNTNMYPFIYSVACVIGNFKNQTCFTESWLRATYNGQPSGAVTHAGSTINQSWLPPMDAQDEFSDLLISSTGPKRSFGGVFANGMFKMIDLNGSGGEDMADTWTCFGDASVQLRTPGTPNGPSSGPVTPTANFSASATTVAPGTTVDFTDSSSGSPSSWSWTFSSGSPSNSSAQNPSVTYNSVGTYDVSLTATNANGSDTETKTNYITVTDTPSYCASTGENWSYEWISGVVVGNLNNTSGAAGYTDFTAYTANLTAGGNVNVQLTPAFASTTYSEYWKIWIDYNRDGDFDDAGEEVFSSNGTASVSGSFTVPSSADGVTTRMRVTMKYNAAPTSCETFSYGEVEDYTVSISAATVNPPVAEFTASTTSISTGDSVTFTDQTTNNPTSWSWTFTGGTPSSSTSQNPTVTYNTAGTYTVQLTASNSAGSDTETKTSYISVTDTPITYCTASSDNQNYEWIAGVNVGSINNSTGASNYTDFTSISANITRGNSVSVTLTPGFASSTYTEYWKIWIDYNHDGDFDDSGEEVFSGSGSSTVNGSFTVSVSATTGSTRMRVIMKYSSAATSCGTFTYGEVEDYTVNIQ
jgi:gingipain R